MTGNLPDQHDRPADQPPESAAPQARGSLQAPRRRLRGISGLIWVLEYAQDALTVTVGIVLILLAVVLLFGGVADFVTHPGGAVSAATATLLDRALLVLILVEIVHTVVLSLRTHHLAAQPFIVVGLVAVIRRILSVLTPGAKVQASTSDLALLIAMVAVFIAGLIAVSRFAPDKDD